MDTKNLLEQLELSDEDEITFLSREETGLDIDMLDMVITSFGDVSNTGEGEFFFLGEDRPEFFVNRIKVTTGVLKENVAVILMELALTNALIPLGGFSYDPDEGCILYSLKIPLVEDLTEEEVINECDLSIRLALNLSRSYAAQFSMLAARREL